MSSNTDSGGANLRERIDAYFTAGGDCEQPDDAGRRARAQFSHWVAAQSRERQLDDDLLQRATPATLPADVAAALVQEGHMRSLWRSAVATAAEAKDGGNDMTTLAGDEVLSALHAMLQSVVVMALEMPQELVADIAGVRSLAAFVTRVCKEASSDLIDVACQVCHVVLVVAVAAAAVRGDREDDDAARAVCECGVAPMLAALGELQGVTLTVKVAEGVAAVLARVAALSGALDGGGPHAGAAGVVGYTALSVLLALVKHWRANAVAIERVSFAVPCLCRGLTAANHTTRQLAMELHEALSDRLDVATLAPLHRALLTGSGLSKALPCLPATGPVGDENTTPSLPLAKRVTLLFDAGLIDSRTLHDDLVLHVLHVTSRHQTPHLATRLLAPSLLRALAECTHLAAGQRVRGLCLVEEHGIDGCNDPPVAQAVARSIITLLLRRRDAARVGLSVVEAAGRVVTVAVSSPAGDADPAGGLAAHLVALCADVLARGWKALVSPQATADQAFDTLVAVAHVVAAFHRAGRQDAGRFTFGHRRVLPEAEALAWRSLIDAAVEFVLQSAAAPGVLESIGTMCDAAIEHCLVWALAIDGPRAQQDSDSFVVPASPASSGVRHYAAALALLWDVVEFAGASIYDRAQAVAVFEPILRANVFRRLWACRLGAGVTTRLIFAAATANPAASTAPLDVAAVSFIALRAPLGPALFVSQENGGGGKPSGSSVSQSPVPASTRRSGPFPPPAPAASAPDTPMARRLGGLASMAPSRVPTLDPATALPSEPAHVYRGPVPSLVAAATSSTAALHAPPHAVLGKLQAVHAGALGALVSLITPSCGGGTAGPEEADHADDLVRRVGIAELVLDLVGAVAANHSAPSGSLTTSLLHPQLLFVVAASGELLHALASLVARCLKVGAAPEAAAKLFAEAVVGELGTRVSCGGLRLLLEAVTAAEATPSFSIKSASTAILSALASAYRALSLSPPPALAAVQTVANESRYTRLKVSAPLPAFTLALWIRLPPSIPAAVRKPTCIAVTSVCELHVRYAEGSDHEQHGPLTGPPPPILEMLAPAKRGGGSNVVASVPLVGASGSWALVLFSASDCGVPVETHREGESHGRDMHGFAPHEHNAFLSVLSIAAAAGHDPAGASRKLVVHSGTGLLSATAPLQGNVDVGPNPLPRLRSAVNAETFALQLSHWAVIPSQLSPIACIELFALGADGMHAAISRDELPPTLLPRTAQLASAATLHHEIVWGIMEATAPSLTSPGCWLSGPLPGLQSAAVLAASADDGPAWNFAQLIDLHADSGTADPPVVPLTSLVHAVAALGGVETFVSLASLLHAFDRTIVPMDSEAARTAVDTLLHGGEEACLSIACCGTAFGWGPDVARTGSSSSVTSTSAATTHATDPHAMLMAAVSTSRVSCTAAARAIVGAGVANFLGLVSQLHLWVAHEASFGQMLACIKDVLAEGSAATPHRIRQLKAHASKLSAKPSERNVIHTLLRPLSITRCPETRTFSRATQASTAYGSAFRDALIAVLRACALVAGDGTSGSVARDDVPVAWCADVLWFAVYLVDNDATMVMDAQQGQQVQDGNAATSGEQLALWLVDWALCICAAVATVSSSSERGVFALGEAADDRRPMASPLLSLMLRVSHAIPSRSAVRATVIGHFAKASCLPDVSVASATTRRYDASDDFWLSLLPCALHGSDEGRAHSESSPSPDPVPQPVDGGTTPGGFTVVVSSASDDDTSQQNGDASALQSTFSQPSRSARAKPPILNDVEFSVLRDWANNRGASSAAATGRRHGLAGPRVSLLQVYWHLSAAHQEEVRTLVRESSGLSTVRDAGAVAIIATQTVVRHFISSVEDGASRHAPEQPYDAIGDFQVTGAMASASALAGAVATLWSDVASAYTGASSGTGMLEAEVLILQPLARLLRHPAFTERRRRLEAGSAAASGDMHQQRARAVSLLESVSVASSVAGSTIHRPASDATACLAARSALRITMAVLHRVGKGEAATPQPRPKPGRQNEAGEGDPDSPEASTPASYLLRVLVLAWEVVRLATQAAWPVALDLEGPFSLAAQNGEDAATCGGGDASGESLRLSKAILRVLPQLAQRCHVADRDGLRFWAESLSTSNPAAAAFHVLETCLAFSDAYPEAQQLHERILESLLRLPPAPAGVPTVRMALLVYVTWMVKPGSAHGSSSSSSSSVANDPIPPRKNYAPGARTGLKLPFVGSESLLVAELRRGGSGGKDERRTHAVPFQVALIVFLLDAVRWGVPTTTSGPSSASFGGPGTVGTATSMGGGGATADPDALSSPLYRLAFDALFLCTAWTEPSAPFAAGIDKVMLTICGRNAPLPALLLQYDAPETFWCRLAALQPRIYQKLDEQFANFNPRQLVAVGDVHGILRATTNLPLPPSEQRLLDEYRHSVRPAMDMLYAFKAHEGTQPATTVDQRPLAAAAAKRLNLLPTWGDAAALLTTLPLPAADTWQWELDPLLGFEHERRRLRRSLEILPGPRRTVIPTSIASSLDDIGLLREFGIRGLQPPAASSAQQHSIHLPELVSPSRFLRQQDMLPHFTARISMGKASADVPTPWIAVTHRNDNNGGNVAAASRVEQHVQTQVVRQVLGDSFDQPPSRRTSQAHMTPSGSPCHGATSAATPASSLRLASIGTPAAFSPGTNALSQITLSELPHAGSFIALEDLTAILVRASPNGDPCGFEFFSTTHDPLLLSFSGRRTAKDFRLELEDALGKAAVARLLLPSPEFRIDPVSESGGIPTSHARDVVGDWAAAWSAGRVTTLRMLLFLNLLAGRSYSDLNQYPFLPHILQRIAGANATSADADAVVERAPGWIVNRRLWFRDLGRPLWDLGDGGSAAISVLGFQKKYVSIGGTITNALGAVEPFGAASRAAEEDKSKRERSACPPAALYEKALAGMQELLPEHFTLPEALATARFDDLPTLAAYVHSHRWALEVPDVRARVHEWVNRYFGPATRSADLPDTELFAAAMYNGFDERTFPEGHTRAHCEEQGVALWTRFTTGVIHWPLPLAVTPARDNARVTNPCPAYPPSGGGDLGLSVPVLLRRHGDIAPAPDNAVVPRACVFAPRLPEPFRLPVAAAKDPLGVRHTILPSEQAQVLLASPDSAAPFLVELSPAGCVTVRTPPPPSASGLSTSSSLTLLRSGSSGLAASGSGKDAAATAAALVLIDASTAGACTCVSVASPWVFAGTVSGLVIAAKVLPGPAPPRSSDGDPASLRAPWVNLYGHEAPVVAVAASRTWRTLFSVDTAGQLRSWDTKAFVPLRTMSVAFAIAKLPPAAPLPAGGGAAARVVLTADESAGSLMVAVSRRAAAEGSSPLARPPVSGVSNRSVSGVSSFTNSFSANRGSRPASPIETTAWHSTVAILSVNLVPIVPPTAPVKRQLRYALFDGDLVLLGTNAGTWCAWVSDPASFSETGRAVADVPAVVDRITLSHGGHRLAIVGADATDSGGRAVKTHFYRANPKSLKHEDIV